MKGGSMPRKNVDVEKVAVEKAAVEKAAVEKVQAAAASKMAVIRKVGRIVVADVNICDQCTLERQTLYFRCKTISS